MHAGVHGDDPAEPAYAAFNTRGNRGQSQYHGVTFSLDSRRSGEDRSELTGRYTLSKAKDNLSTTFSDSANGNGELQPRLPRRVQPDARLRGYAEFDVRHRLSIGAIWNLPFLNDGSGMK